MADAGASKLASFKKQISVNVRSTDEVTPEQEPPMVDVLPTPTIQEVDKTFEQELEALEKEKAAQ